MRGAREEVVMEEFLALFRVSAKRSKPMGERNDSTIARLPWSS